MVRKEITPWDRMSVDDRLYGADTLARLYGKSDFWYWNATPYFWCWKGTDKTGNEFGLSWDAGN